MQERFGTDDPDEALSRAREKSLEYDACWFRDDEGSRTLMTRVALSAYKVDRGCPDLPNAEA